MNTNDPSLLTVDELAARAGVPVRTVRFYIAEGLLPGAITRGKGASYTQEHLDRLQLIRLLSARHMPLADIHTLVTRLPSDETRAVVQEEQARADAIAGRADALSPKAYLAALLEQARGYPDQRDAGGSLGSGDADSAARYLQDAPSAESPTSRSFSPLEESYSATKLRLRKQPPRREQAASWHRWELAPGIELHIRADVARAQQEVIERVLNAARAVLAHDTHDMPGTLDNQQKE